MTASGTGPGGRPSRVLFACVHNAGRSQMASAFFNAAADPALAVSISAGTEPAEQVHPRVVAAMREVGIDLSSARPQLLTAEVAAGVDRLVTMGCGENACPVIPAVRREDWPLADPSEKSLEQVRLIRDDICGRVDALVSNHGWTRQEA